MHFHFHFQFRFYFPFSIYIFIFRCSVSVSILSLSFPSHPLWLCDFSCSVSVSVWFRFMFFSLSSFFFIGSLEWIQLSPAPLSTLLSSSQLSLHLFDWNWFLVSRGGFEGSTWLKNHNNHNHIVCMALHCIACYFSNIFKCSSWLKA